MADRAATHWEVTGAGDDSDTNWLSQKQDLRLQEIIYAHKSFVYRRATHAEFGPVVLKYCRPDVGDDEITRLRWELVVTRGLQHIANLHVPQGALCGGVDTQYAIVFASFPAFTSEESRVLGDTSPATSPSPAAAAAVESSATLSSSSLGSLQSTVAPRGQSLQSLSPQSTVREITLSTYLKANPIIDVDQALTLLRRIATVLSAVHACNIVYCNISPDTISLYFPSGMKNWSDMEARLCDFSYARRQGGDLVSPNTVELDVCGDPRFMAPESTGRTNRAVDARSDIYGLGMLLHGALTGEMPDRDTSPLKIIHYHVAVMPAPLIQVADVEHCSLTQAKVIALQRMLDCMVAKLPENRFRTCTDIMRSLDALAATGTHPQHFYPPLSIEPLDLLHLLNSSKLYGCGNQVNELRAFQQEVYQASEGGLAIVSGPSGVGKTAVVHELMLPACKLGGSYCAGKFEQFKDSLPYLAFVQACSDLINLLLAEDRSTVVALAKTISAQIGDNAMLMLDMIPNLRFLLAAGDALPDELAHSNPQQSDDEERCMVKKIALPSATLHPERILRRLRQGLTCFLAIVAAYRPLTIFLDDMQWADSSSLKLVADLVATNIPRRLLLILAYRSDDPATEGSIQRLHQAIEPKRSYMTLLELKLADLPVSAIKNMLCDVLLQPAADQQQSDLSGLAVMLHAKTHGNALYVRRSLQVLIESQALTLTGPNGQWTLNEERTREILSADSAVDMVTMQMQGMPVLTRFALGLGALLGSTFDADALAQMLRLPRQVILSGLRPAIAGGYIRLVNGNHPMVTDSEEERDISGDDYATLCSYSAINAALCLPDLRSLESMELVASGLRYSLVPASRTGGADMATSKPESGHTLGSVIDFGRWGTPSQFGERISPAPSGSHSTQEEPLVQYQWVHDRLQQAAVRLIKEDELELAYKTVGCWLLEAMLEKDSTRPKNNLIFDVIHHLSMGTKHQRQTIEDKVGLIKLLIVACSRARACSAFDTALRYARQARDLVDDAIWQQYHGIAFRASHSLIATLYDSSQFSEMQALIDVMLQQPLESYHRAMVLELKVNSHGSQGDYSNAVKYGREALALLGHPLPEDVDSMRLIKEKAPEDVQEIEALLKRPKVKNLFAATAVRIVAALVSAVWVHSPALFAPLILVGMDISINHGNSDCGAFSYACFGMILISEGNAPAGHAYGRLAMKALASLPPSHLKCAVELACAQHTLAWIEPVSYVERVMQGSVEAGKSWLNDEYLGYSVGSYLDLKLMEGVNLHELQAECFRLRPLVEKRMTSFGSSYHGIIHATVRHLVNKHFTPVAAFYTPAPNTTLDFGGDVHEKVVYRYCLLSLYLAADDIPAAMRCINSVSSAEMQPMKASFVYANFEFKKGLTLVRHLMLEHGADAVTTFSDLHKIVSVHERWAQDCQATFACRLELLRGCLLWLQGQILPGLMHLGKCLDLAKKHSFIYVEAAANEMTALLWKHEGQSCLAAPYFVAAQHAYKQWGAEWKARSLDPSGTTPHTPTSACGDEVDLLEIDSTPSAQVGATDLETICDWTVALASQRTKEGLLEQFMRTTMLYSTSREGCLLWSQDHDVSPQTINDMFCYVSGSSGETSNIHIQIRPKQSYIDNLAALVNYVLRTRQTLTDTSPAVASLVQRGLVEARPGSFVLAPISRRDQCIGVLWLTNPLTTSVSSNGKRLKLLELLKAQLMTSVENLRLLRQLHEHNDMLQAQAVTLEAMVQKRTAELEQANRRLSSEVTEREKAEMVAKQAAAFNRTFLHNMSHELRTPLNCIIGMAELLKNSMLSKEQIELASPLFSSAEDLLQIVNDVLDLSKIQAGKLVLKAENFSLRDVVDRSLGSIAVQAANKSITLAALYPASVPSALRSDSTRIGQVLRNLLSNAVKFTDKGQIVVRVRATAIPDSANAYKFEIQCTDTGMGIPDDQMHLLFKPFSQVDSSTTRKHGGTGLGLSISKCFAELLGGHLSCESEAGKGSTFTFALISEVTAEPEAPLPTSTPLSIIVCHPKAVIREMISGYLSNSMHQVKSVDAEHLHDEVAKLDSPQTSVFVVQEEDVAIVPASCSRVLLTKLDQPGEAGAGVYYLREPVRQSKLLQAVSSVIGDAISLTSSEPTPAATAHTSHRPQFSIRVLVAEDNPINRLVAKKLLVKFGIHAKFVENGQEAVRTCEQRDFDLVLMDIMMPVMDGQEATVAIRETLPKERQPKIVALTANAFDEDRHKYMACGMDDVLIKPLQLEALQTVLCQYFSPSPRSP
ncbi:hypothetical protein RI367_002097 [Sorochytrium milnesiophthora]